MQLQVARRVRGALVLPGFGVITQPGQVVLHHLILLYQVRFGLVRLAKLHLHGPPLVHRLHQRGQPLHIAPVLKGTLQAELLQPAPELPHSKKRVLHVLGIHGGGIAQQQVAGLEVLFHVDAALLVQDARRVQHLLAKRALLPGGEQHLVGLPDLLVRDLRHLHVRGLRVLAEELP